MDKIYLGKTSSTFSPLPNERIYLTKHKWDCGWYWGMGYIGNTNLHTHFNSVFLKTQYQPIKNIFSETKITDKDWWVIRDLFVQAYALKECAEVYRHGGYQTTLKETTDIIQSKEMENKLNADLKIVLDKLWDFIQEITKEKD